MKKIGNFDFFGLACAIAIAFGFVCFCVNYCITYDLNKGIIHYNGDYTAVVTDFEVNTNGYGGRWYYVYFVIPDFGDFEFKIENEKLYMNTTYGDKINVNCNDLSLLPKKNGSYTVVSYDFDLKVGEK